MGELVAPVPPKVTKACSNFKHGLLQFGIMILISSLRESKAFGWNYAL